MEEHVRKSHRPSLSFSPSSFISRLKLRNNTDPPPSPVETEHDALLASDPELDVEPSLPALKELLGARALALKQQERNRQEILNELLHTERLHLRVLRVLDEMFRKPLLSDYQQVAHHLFPELEQILSLHREFNKQLQARRDDSHIIQQVADVFLSLFDGDTGRLYSAACAEYCRKQKQTLWNVKKCKDPHLTQLISKSESSPICRQMKLKDMVSAQMQRLAHYPVFIGDVIKYTDDSEELCRLEKALQESRNIEAYVKQSVLDYENYYRLSAIVEMLDKSSIDNSPNSYLYTEVRDLDPKRNTLVYDGVLSMKLRSHRMMDVHVVLLENIMVLLQKQDDKLVLCHFNDKETYKSNSPLLQRQKLLAREDAADKKAFMVINSRAYKPEMYQFVAQSKVERDRWVKYLSQSVARPVSTPPHGTKDPSISQTHPSKPNPTTPPHKLTRISTETADSLIQPHEVHISDPVVEQAEQVLTPIDKLRRNDQALKASLEERNDILASITVVTSGDHDDHHSNSICLIKQAEEINTQLTQLVIDSKDLSAPETSQSLSTSTGQQKVTLPISVQQLLEVTSKMNDCINKLHVVIQNQSSEKRRLIRELSETNGKLDRVSNSTQLTQDLSPEVDVDTADRDAKQQPPVDEAADGDTEEEREREQEQISHVEQANVGTRTKHDTDLLGNPVQESKDISHRSEELSVSTSDDTLSEDSVVNSNIEIVSTTESLGDLTMESSCSMPTTSRYSISLEELGDTDTDSVQTLEGVVLPGDLYAEDPVAGEQTKTTPNTENSDTKVSSEGSSGDLSRFYPDFRL
ncbi:uncharacterized protein [Haliotis asinina]|uniref:uncharacterized protein n=1 Tax=Haliotis asinina TaxID=109174 RepID=UPI00353205B8